MRRIEKKCWPKEFQAVSDGTKTFDLRLNDFDIAEGDTLVLKEWNPDTKTYTGRELEEKASYVGKFNINNLFGQSKADIEKYGLQIISLE